MAASAAVNKQTPKSFSLEDIFVTPFMTTILGAQPLASGVWLPERRRDSPAVGTP